VRKTFPEHLPRERVVIEAPTACSCCGSSHIVKMGEDITETLEVIPRQWKVIQTVREKFTCRDCEKISQPPAPFHPTPRGWAGPSLLAMIAFEAVKRIDAVFTIEREINGHDPAARLAVRQRQSAPLVEDLERWLRSERALLSKHVKVAKAIDYLLSSDHWPSFQRFLEDGRVCLTNNCAERSLRGVALGRRSWLFAGSERGGHRAAFMYSLIGSAKLNDIDPQAWLADVIARISDLPVSRLPELLPRNWQQSAAQPEKAA